MAVPTDHASVEVTPLTTANVVMALEPAAAAATWAAVAEAVPLLVTERTVPEVGMVMD